MTTTNSAIFILTYIIPVKQQNILKYNYILLEKLSVNFAIILNTEKCGFREKYSTYLAILKLVDDISEQLSNENYCIGIFIDLSKAFDIIDHKLLITKMQYYGWPIRVIALD